MDPLIDGRPVEGFPAYRVTPDGQVWTCWKRANTLGRGKGYVLGDTWKPMKFGHNQYGHKQIGLNNGDGKGQIPHLVHRLVLETFVGPCPPGMQCRHMDGDPGNNHVSNLSWGTARQNQLDRRRHGTSMEGVKHPMVRFTEEQILSIIAELNSGARQIDVAAKYGTKQGHISNIYRGKAWSHLHKERIS
jgi:hypothetical protein